MWERGPGHGDARSERRSLTDAAGVLATNILLENTEFNRRLIKAWMDAATSRPLLFCESAPQEQAMFTLVAQHFNVTMVNACPYMRDVGYNKCQDRTKSAKWFLETLTSGAYEVLLPEELDSGLVAGYDALHEAWRALMMEKGKSRDAPAVEASVDKWARG